MGDPSSASGSAGVLMKQHSGRVSAPQHAQQYAQQQAASAPARPGVNTIVFGNPFSVGIAHGAQSLGNTGKAAVASFRTKPGQTTVIALGYLTWLLAFVATFTDWYHYATTGFNLMKVYGGTTLFVMRVCFDGPTGRETWVANRFCTSVGLADIALKLDYFRVAGTVSFVFLIVALLAIAAANFFVNMRRRDELDQRIHVRLGGLRSPLLPLYLYAAGLGALGIAWASYAGIVSINWNETDFQRAMNAIGSWRYRGFAGGFGCAIAAVAVLLPTMVVFVLFRNEVNRDVAKAGEAAAAGATSSGGGGIATTAYSGGLPPARVKEPYYPTDSADLGVPTTQYSSSSASYGGDSHGPAYEVPPSAHQYQFGGSNVNDSAFQQQQASSSFDGDLQGRKSRRSSNSDRSRSNAALISVGVSGTHVAAPAPDAFSTAAATAKPDLASPKQHAQQHKAEVGVTSPIKQWYVQRYLAAARSPPPLPVAQSRLPASGHSGSSASASGGSTASPPHSGGSSSTSGSDEKPSYAAVVASGGGSDNSADADEVVPHAVV